MVNHKIERISSDVAHIISNILANEADDELLKTITITGCEVTNDLGYAKVYFTSLNEMAPKDLEKELNEAAPFVRGRLSESIELRHTPEIRFIYDKSIAYGNKIESIIKEINK